MKKLSQPTYAYDIQRRSDKDTQYRISDHLIYFHFFTSWHITSNFLIRFRHRT